MNISINTEMNIFKENLINLIGNSQLPVGIIYYIIKDVFLNIENLYNQTLEKENQEIVASIGKDKINEAEKEKNDKEQE